MCLCTGGPLSTPDSACIRLLTFAQDWSLKYGGQVSKRSLARKMGHRAPCAALCTRALAISAWRTNLGSAEPAQGLGPRRAYGAISSPWRPYPSQSEAWRRTQYPARTYTRVRQHALSESASNRHTRGAATRLHFFMLLERGLQLAYGRWQERCSACWL